MMTNKKGEENIFINIAIHIYDEEEEDLKIFKHTLLET